MVDSRRVPNADDRAVLAALYDIGVPLIVVATKSDKLKGSEVESAMEIIREGLGLPDGQPLRVSGVTGEGIKDLWRIVLDACETRVDELKLALQEGRDDGGVMRVLDEEDEIDEWYKDDLLEDENFEDGEDVYYDQGYAWVRGESGDEGSGGYDDFYNGDVYVEDADDISEANWNEEKQRMENESFKLKNLKKRVEEMERRGEI